MPPKKKARLGPDLLSALPPQLAQRLEPSELTTAHLLSAYGLDGPLDDDDEADPLRLCTPKWIEDQSEPLPLTTTPEVIVLGDSEDDNMDEVKPKQRGKGKGKGKEKATVCSVDNCAKNPRCLNWLGQDKWEDTEKAFKAFKKAASLGQDPNNERDGDLPVGLRNLGATCYANSFLQVWFQDVTFRSGVYACLPPASGDVESSPLFQLQVLFAFLQTANQAVYDPEPLVTSLKLDKTEQQDSQEFSKLFMTLLDGEFKKHGARAASEGLGGLDVAKLVSTQFEGEKTFGTECNSCQTLSERTATFWELEINLSKDCVLGERIAQALEEESLEGDNQYFCGNCNKLQNATRFVRLNTLPPVLHFSLLRFIFNTKDFTRSKSQHVIKYPLKLDMGQFLPADDFGVRPEAWYDLKGVLMHKGTSAHHGHYVAQVHDASKNKWYLFDDEAVTSIEDLNAPDRYDEEEASTSKQKAAKKNPNFPCAQRNAIRGRHE